MSKTKELDILVNKVTEEILEKLYKVSDFHLSYSDINIEGDEYNETHVYIMDKVIEKLHKFNKL
jgi:hypothetical protein